MRRARPALAFAIRPIGNRRRDDGLPRRSAVAPGCGAFGVGAKLCIHPAQIESVNAGYAPQAEAIAWAERVIAAVEQQGRGVITVDGKLIDKPLLLKARGVLQTAG